MADVRGAMRFKDRRWRTAPAIARLSGCALRTARAHLQEMEKRGEVETKRGIGGAHGNKKFWKLR